jgi:hypothetical protein
MSKNKAKQAEQVGTPEGIEAQDGADAAVDQTSEVESEQAEQAHAVTVRMTHDGITSFSMNGTQYDAVDGVFELPDDVAALAAQQWGLVPAAEGAE